jgi:hypothetical protein
MAMNYLNRQQLKRLSPFDGLMIDAAAWTDAHGYHQEQQRLHALALHGAGIVAGLDVAANDPPDQSVTIHPGLAIDPRGDIILVTQPQRYYLQPKEAGTVYLIIEFREVGVERATYDGDRPARILEAYRIQQRESLPDEPHVELARLRVEGSGQPVRESRDPLNPRANELDLRFRPVAAIRQRGELSVGALVPKAGGDLGLLRTQGLSNLARELSMGCGCTSTFRGPVQLGRDADRCVLLYLTGGSSFTLDQYELAALGAYLESGGVILAEPYVGDDAQAAAFAARFKAVANYAKSELAPVGRGHPLLSSRFPFSTPPQGAAGGGELLEGGGLIYSGSDYGSAWAGGREDRPLERAAIRDALEFGINVAFHAEARTRARMRTTGRAG